MTRIQLHIDRKGAFGPEGDYCVGGRAVIATK